MLGGVELVKGRTRAGRFCYKYGCDCAEGRGGTAWCSGEEERGEFVKIVEWAGDVRNLDEVV
jgi:hypothetical protein